MPQSMEQTAPMTRVTRPKGRAHVHMDTHTHAVEKISRIQGLKILTSFEHIQLITWPVLCGSGVQLTPVATRGLFEELLPRQPV